MGVRSLFAASSSGLSFPDPFSGDWTLQVSYAGPNGTPYDPGAAQVGVNNVYTGLWRRAGLGNWWNGSFATTNMSYLWGGTNVMQSKSDSYVSFGSQPDSQTYYSMEWLGYVYVQDTDTYDLRLQSDDQSMMWIGTNAITGYTGSNCHTDSSKLVNTNSVMLTGGLYYPIRIWYNEQEGGNSMQLFMGKSGSPGTLLSMNNWGPVHDGSTSGLNENNYSLGGWQLTSSSETPSEGVSCTFTAKFRGLADGTTAYWKVTSASNISDERFSAKSGSGTITNNSYSWNITVSNDSLTANAQQSYTVYVTDNTGNALYSNSRTIIVYDPPS